jgi:hypothetical protein
MKVGRLAGSDECELQVGRVRQACRMGRSASPNCRNGVLPNAILDRPLRCLRQAIPLGALQVDRPLHSSHPEVPDVIAPGTAEEIAVLAARDASASLSPSDRQSTAR